MTKKKKVILLVSAAVCTVAAVLTIGVTLSYLGDRKGKENIINVGYGNVDINEEFSEPSEQSMINEDIQKKIYVQNNGTVPSFARLYVDFSDSETAANATIKYKGYSYTSWAAFKNALAATGGGRTIESDWVYVPEDPANGKLGGYFYYTKKLAPKQGNALTGESTPTLFDTVTLDYNKYDGEHSPVDSNIDRIHAVDMIVYSELIQTVETGTTQVSGEDGEHNLTVSDVYGYDYGTNNEWRAAWESFLK